MAKIKAITQKRLENIALFYLERYESSSFKLKEILRKRVYKAQVQGQEIPSEASTWIDQIVCRMQSYGYIDDKRYAENLIRRLLAQGKSVRYLVQKLKQSGITDDQIQSLLEETQKSSCELDLDSAKKLVFKKKIGCYRKAELQKDKYQKDLAMLARAGFSYEIAKEALGLDDQDN